MDLKKKAERGDIILTYDEHFYIKNKLDLVINNKSCCSLSRNAYLKSDFIEYYIVRTSCSLPEKYYVLDLKTKIKPGRI